MDPLARVFGSGPLSALPECVRTVLVFAYGLLLVRLAGRHIFGKWSALDSIVSIMIGSKLSRAWVADWWPERGVARARTARP